MCRITLNFAQSRFNYQFKTWWILQSSWIHCVRNEWLLVNFKEWRQKNNVYNSPERYIWYYLFIVQKSIYINIGKLARGIGQIRVVTFYRCNWRPQGMNTASLQCSDWSQWLAVKVFECHSCLYYTAKWMRATPTSPCCVIQFGLIVEPRVSACYVSDLCS